jgi:hypothetical protein
MNVLNKDSETISAVLNLQRKATIASINLQSAAESKNVVVRYSAIIAQKILNAVMSANPVLLLVTGMLALGAAIMFFVDKAMKASKQLEILNKVESELFNMQEARIENIKRESEERLSAYQDRVKEAKAEGVSQLELLNLEIETAKVRKENASQLQSQYNSTVENIQTLIETITKQRAKYEELFFSKDAYKKEKKALIEQAKVQLDLNVKRLNTLLAANKEFAEADLDLYTKEAEKIRLLKQIEIRDARAVLESKLSKTKEESMQEFEFKLAIMQQEKEKELLNFELTEKEKQAIIDKYSRQEIDLRKAYREQQNKNDLNAITSIANAELAATIEGTKENHEAKLKFIDAEYLENKYNIEKTIKDEVLKLAKLEELNANYLKNQREQNKAFALQEMDFQNSQLQGQEQLNIIKNQEIIAGNKLNIIGIIEARDNIYNINQQAINREIKLNKDKYAQGLINEKEYQSKLTELTIESENLRLSKIEANAQAERNARQFTKDAILNTVSQIISAEIAESELNTQLIDKRLSDAEKRLNEEKKLNEDGVANNLDATKREIALLNAEKKKAL